MKPLVEGARIASLADYRERYDKSLLDPQASEAGARVGGSRESPRGGALGWWPGGTAAVGGGRAAIAIRQRTCGR